MRPTTAESSAIRPTRHFFLQKVCPEVPLPFPFKVRRQNAKTYGQIERRC
jgi:hypothetical protein